ncbi:unknown [Akkermansia sp. CAG:344]|nr:unknown [Akkermansia sp. CAG:344]
MAGSAEDVERGEQFVFLPPRGEARKADAGAAHFRRQPFQLRCVVLRAVPDEKELRVPEVEAAPGPDEAFQIFNGVETAQEPGAETLSLSPPDLVNP